MTILTKPVTYIVTLILLFALWHIASISLQQAILPTPQETLAALSQLFDTNTIRPDHAIMPHLFASFNRIVLSILISFILGVPLGLAIGYEPQLERFLSPLIYLLYPIPKIVLMPIIILFLGLDDISKISLIVLVLFFQIVVTTRDAVKKIPDETLDSFYALGGKRHQTYLHVLWPAALADVLTMLRQSVGMAIAVLFFAETYATNLGLGFLIRDFNGIAEYDKMYAAILVMAVLGVAFFMLIDLLEWRFCRWRRNSNH